MQPARNLPEPEVHVRYIVLHVIGPRHEVSDIVHDVFVTALQDIERLHEAAAMKAWLSGIAVFQSKSFLRRQRRFRMLALFGDLRVVLPPSPATPEVSAALRAAYQVLDELAPDERIPFVLRAVQGLGMEEVADCCGVSLATAKRRVASEPKAALPPQPRPFATPSAAAHPPRPPASPQTPSDLRKEVDDTATIRSLVRTDPARALRLIQEARLAHPRASLGEERDAFEVLALSGLGRKAHAAEKAAQFLRRYPGSSFSAKVQAVVPKEPP